jgi:hypothetical protein
MAWSRSRVACHPRADTEVPKPDFWAGLSPLADMSTFTKLEI